MVGGEPAALGVARADGVSPRLAQPQEDDRHPGALQRVVHVRAAGHECQEDDPGDAMAEQRVDPGDRDLLCALDVAEHRRVAEAECRAFHHLGHLRVVRVAEVAEQDAEHHGALLHELARDRVGLVIQPLDRLQHALAGAVRHLLHPTHHVGHRRLRHSGLRSDVEDGGRLASRGGALRPVRGAGRFHRRQPAIRPESPWREDDTRAACSTSGRLRHWPRPRRIVPARAAPRALDTFPSGPVMFVERSNKESP